MGAHFLSKSHQAIETKEAFRFCHKWMFSWMWVQIVLKSSWIKCLKLHFWVKRHADFNTFITVEQAVLKILTQSNNAICLCKPTKEANLLKKAPCSQMKTSPKLLSPCQQYKGDCSHLTLSLSGCAQQMCVVCMCCVCVFGGAWRDQ